LLPEDASFYLKEDVLEPEAVKEWTERIDHG
jgi:hypothetical protein